MTRVGVKEKIVPESETDYSVVQGYKDLPDGYDQIGHHTQVILLKKDSPGFTWCVSFCFYNLIKKLKFPSIYN